MFRIACIVDDKNLPKVLHALSGLVLNMEPPQPVVNAEVKGGKVKQASSGIATWERIWDMVHKLPNGSIYTSANLKADIIKAGGVENSFSYFSKVLRDNGLIKATKNRGEYVVTGGKEK